MNVFQVKSTPIFGVWELGKIDRIPIYEEENENTPKDINGIYIIPNPPIIDDLIQLIKSTGAYPVNWYWNTGLHDNIVRKWHIDGKFDENTNYMLIMSAADDNIYGTWFGEAHFNAKPSLQLLNDSNMMKSWQSNVWTIYLVNMNVWHRSPQTTKPYNRCFYRTLITLPDEVEKFLQEVE
jgi:hypothetical protein